MLDVPATGPALHSAPSATETVLTNGRIVTPEDALPGTVVIRDGIIADVDAGVSAVSGAIDLDGDFLVPGLIDLHTDNLEKHIEPRPGVRWPTLAALTSHDRQLAAAGITTVFDSLYVAGSENPKDKGRAEALVMAIEALEFAQDDGLMMADHLLHLRCELGWEATVDFLSNHIDNPLVRLVSVMDHTPGQRQWRDIDKWRQFNSRKFTPDELTEILGNRRADQERHAARNRHAVVTLCKERSLPVASHDDTTVDHVDEAFSEGVSISEFPCTEDAARRARDLGLATVMGAPNVVKGGSHSGNVAAGTLAEAGLLDGLASDYVPVSMIEGAFLLHERHAMPLPDAIATVTANPARMVGMEDRGAIRVGLRADLVRVHPYHHMPVVCAVWRQGRQLM
jgi:alpha-D-ribose 1-methylphosphonate 5-triphosphate diphosphatase